MSRDRLREARVRSISLPVRRVAVSSHHARSRRCASLTRSGALAEPAVRSRECRRIRTAATARLRWSCRGRRRCGRVWGRTRLRSDAGQLRRWRVWVRSEGPSLLTTTADLVRSRSGYDSQPSAYNQAPAPSAYGAPNSYAPPVGQGDAYAMQPLNGGAGRANGSLIGPDLGPFFAEVRTGCSYHSSVSRYIRHGQLMVKSAACTGRVDSGRHQRTPLEHQRRL